MKQITLSISALVLGFTLVACGGDKAAEEKQAEEAAPAEQVQEAAPVEQAQEAVTEEKAAETAPAEQVQEAAPVEQAQDSASMEAAPEEQQAQEAAPAEQEQAQDAAPAEKEEAPAEQAAASSVDGEAVYKGLCFSCHDAGIAGSPKLGDAAAWAPRIATGMDALYATSLNGKGAMPAKGGNPALTDDEVKAAVDYMVSQSQ